MMAATINIAKRMEICPPLRKKMGRLALRGSLMGVKRKRSKSSTTRIKIGNGIFRIEIWQFEI